MLEKNPLYCSCKALFITGTILFFSLDLDLDLSLFSTLDFPHLSFDRCNSVLNFVMYCRQAPVQRTCGRQCCGSGSGRNDIITPGMTLTKKIKQYI
jgi:hypothetical protein